MLAGAGIGSVHDSTKEPPVSMHIARWSPALLIALAGSAQTLGAGPFGATFELSSLDGARGFTIIGVNEDDVSGAPVGSAGDLNGDGIEDLVIAATGAGSNGSNAGATYVVFGGAGLGSTGAIDLASLNGTNGFVINGVNQSDRSGESATCAGDINGDGIDDLVIGARYAGSYGQAIGASYVVFGGAGVGAGGALDLASLNGTNGFVINGIDTGDRSGKAASAAGDVNNDGIDDLVIGAFMADPGFRDAAGECYIVFGGIGVGSSGFLDLSALNGTNGFIINGIDPGDEVGFSVSSAGDANGDNIDDLLLGAFVADPGGKVWAGETYVVFGATGLGASGSLELSTLNGANGFVINGIDESDRSGVSVAAAGDINGDGEDDLIIGANYAEPNGVSEAGESYVIFGGPGLGASGAIELASLNGSNGFVLNGAAAGDRSGGSVAPAGDLNGDGFADVVIGARYADPNGENTGESYVVFGSTTAGAGGVIELGTLNGINGFTLAGILPDNFSGASCSFAGDVNNDGIDDLIVGAAGADPGGVNGAGESYIIFGRIDCPGDITFDGVVDAADLGGLIGAFGGSSDAADINGDGIVNAADLGLLIAAFGDSCP